MRLFPDSYNGFLFQQKNKVESDFANPYDWNISGITTSDIPLSNKFPLRVSKNFTGAVKVINVNLLDVDLTRDSLVIAMDVLGEDQIQLISHDEFGRKWYVNADFIGLTEDTTSDKTASFGAIFAVDDPIWKKLIPSEQTITVDGVTGTGSGVITPIGNQPALPVITITPLSAGSNDFGFLYQRFITIVNNSPNAWNAYPVDVTGGGLDTAALILAGKMLSTGDDCRIYVNGVDVKRWFGDGGIDAASTSIWINLTLPANSNMTLGDNIAGAGLITEIQFENTAANIAMIELIPLSGNVLIDSEIFVYTGINKSLLKLTGITRAEKQTSMGAHTIGDIIYFIPDAWLYYGNPNIAPYVVDDTYKPVIDLVNSTNTNHIYDSLFYTLEGKRTAAWVPETPLPSLDSAHYTATENTLADPAEVIGIWTTTASLLRWRYYNPCGVVQANSITGKKYSANGTFSAQVNWSMFGISYNQILDLVESVPSPLLTWVSLDTHTNVVIPPALIDPYYKAYYLQLRSYGFSGAGNDPANGIEFDLVDLELDPATTPTVTLASESTNFNAHSVLYNEATGFSLEIDISLQFLTYVVINTKDKTVTLYDGSNQINAIQDFPIRAEWFPLLPGQENEITITDAGNVQYDFAWEDRSL